MGFGTLGLIGGSGGSAPTPAPIFTTQPSINPASGNSSTVFTAGLGAASNATNYVPRWILDGTTISYGPTVIVGTAGHLVLEVTAIGLGGKTIATTAQITVGLAPVVPVLGMLSLSAIGFPAGAAPGTLIATIYGKNAGSQPLTLSDDQGGRFAIASGNQLVVGLTVSVAGTTYVPVVRETLGAASNSPRDTPLQVMALPSVLPAPIVTAVAGTGADLGNIILTFTDLDPTKVASHRIYRGTSVSSFTYIQNPTTAAYTNGPLTVGAAVYYRVSSVDQNGNEGALCQVIGPIYPLGLPAAPTVTLTPGNGKVTAAWTDGPNGGLPTGSHRIYVGTATGTETFLFEQPVAGGGTYDIPGTNGTPLFVQVSTVTPAGEGLPSTEVSAAPTAGAVPTLASYALNVTVQRGAPASGSFAVSGGTTPYTLIDFGGDQAPGTSLAMIEPNLVLSGMAL